MTLEGKALRVIVRHLKNVSDALSEEVDMHSEAREELDEMWYAMHSIEAALRTEGDSDGEWRGVSFESTRRRFDVYRVRRISVRVKDVFRKDGYVQSR